LYIGDGTVAHKSEENPIEDPHLWGNPWEKEPEIEVEQNPV
jgi:hypothetical protein